VEIGEILNIVSKDEKTGQLTGHMELLAEGAIHVKGLIGSSPNLLISGIYQHLETNHLIVLPDKESAAYFLNDLESIFDEKGNSFHKKKILFFPTSL